MNPYGVYTKFMSKSRKSELRLSPAAKAKSEPLFQKKEHGSNSLLRRLATKRILSGMSEDNERNVGKF